jgi:hypothetical protein
LLGKLKQRADSGIVVARGDRGPTLVLSSSIQNPVQSIIGTRASSIILLQDFWGEVSKKVKNL